MTLFTNIFYIITCIWMFDSYPQNAHLSIQSSDVSTTNAPLTVYFQKPSAWANANIYFWNASPAGSNPNGTWPGVPMNLMQVGCDWYYYTFPAGMDCTNLIFNCGSSSCQTADLYRCSNGYYIVGDGWFDTPPTGFCGNPPPSVSVNPEGPFHSDEAFIITINVYDNSDPDPVIYYTLDGSDPTTSSESGYSGMTLNISENTNLSVMGQDAEGAVSEIQTHIYTVGERIPLTVYFLKPSGWGAPKIYYWNPDPAGSADPVTWPGVNMTQNQAGCDWYHYTFPEDVFCINLIFNNNGSPQTADLYRCENGYYILGTGWADAPPAGFCSQNSAPVLTVTPESSSCVIPIELNISAIDADNDPVNIHYTLDGTVPDTGSPLWIPGTIPPASAFTLRVRAYDDQMAASAEVIRNYSANDLPPAHGIIPSGPMTFNAALNIQITATDDCSDEAIIYYTTDGSDPDFSSALSVNQLTLYITGTTTVKYFVADNTGHFSDIQTHTYQYDPNFGCGANQDDYFSWDNATVYFLITDRFRNGNTGNDLNYGRQPDLVGGFHGGDLAGVTQKITEGYFDSLGVDAIWITPPVEQIHGHVPAWGDDPDFLKHYGYHGYYTLDWTEPDANIGTEDEFRTMVDSAHAHGIRIIMDVVMNHTGYDTPEDMAEFGWSDCTNWWSSDWIRKDDIDYCTPCGGGYLQSCLAGLPDIVSEATEEVGLPPVLITKWDAAKEAQEIAELDDFFTNSGLPRTPVNHIVKWLTDWVRAYGIDAFRLDTYKHIELEHWGTLKTQAALALAEWKANHPDKALDNKPFWMVGENYGSGIGKWDDAINIGKTDALINFSFQGQAGNLAGIDNVYTSYAAVANPDPDWNFLSYISSHDTQLSNRNNLITEGTTMLLLPGAVQIFYGDETKRPAGPGPGDQPTRSFMNWNSIDQNVLNHWKKIGQFRKNHPSVGAGSHFKISDSPYTFKRSLSTPETQDEIIAVLGASGNVTVNVSSIPSWTNGTLLRNAYDGQTALVINGHVTFNAGPHGVILIENPNPVILPSITASPSNNTYDPDGMSVCLSGSSIDCQLVTVYYTMDLNAPETDFSNWTTYSGCFPISENITFKAIAVNNNNPALKSQTLILNYFVTLPDMTIYYRNTQGYSNVYLYHWNTLPAGPGNASTAWPGKLMSLACDNGTPALTDDWHVLTLPATLSTNLIFSCGNNSCQTANLTAPATLSFFENGQWSTVVPVNYCAECKTVSNTQNDGHGSLRYAIACAVPGSTLAFSQNLDNSVIGLSEPIEIAKDLIIPANLDLTIDGSSLEGPVFSILNQKTVLLEGFHIICSETGEISCILNQGILTLDNMHFEEHESNSGNSSVINQYGGQIRVQNEVRFQKYP